MTESAQHTRQDTRDRVIAMEAEMKHVRQEMADVHAKVNEMHTLLIQAKGARWMLLALVAIGGFAAAKIGPFLAIFFPPK